MGHCPPGYLPVRCCCTPRKVLGYLSLHHTPAAPGVRVSWPVRAAGLAKWGDVISPVPADMLTLEIRQICDLEVDPHGVGQRITSLAFYSEETPVERLRQVPGFIEYFDERW